MAENTNIEWCNHTANLWWGCTEVHKGCDRCYARTFARAKGKGDGWDGARYATVSVWKELLKWNAAAKASGTTARVFVGSMMDIFEKSMPVVNWNGTPRPGVETGHLRDRYLREVVPATPNLLHLLLTKRPSNVLKMVPPEWLVPGGWPSNVMTGTSPVDQQTADTLIPQLLCVPGWHFLSMEPMLGPVDLTTHLWGRPKPCDDCPKDGDCVCGYARRGTVFNDPALNWVIAGGESGPKARPMHPDWARSLRDQCQAAGVPFLFKQWGEWNPGTVFEAVNAKQAVRIEPSGASHPWPPAFDPRCGDWCMHKVGKKAAGRQLDGVEHNGFPT